MTIYVRVSKARGQDTASQEPDLKRWAAAQEAEVRSRNLTTLQAPRTYLQPDRSLSGRPAGASSPSDSTREAGGGMTTVVCGATTGR